MAAVIAAIGAAFLAGGVALFREHRLQQRELLVAARVMFATFGAAKEAIRVALETDGWARFNAVPDRTSFTAAWDSHKGSLAGHLTWHEWESVDLAATHYLALRTMDQVNPPADARQLLETTKQSLEAARESLLPYSTQRLSAWKVIRRGISVEPRVKDISENAAQRAG